MHVSTAGLGARRRGSHFRGRQARQSPRVPLGKGNRVELSQVDGASKATVGEWFSGWMKDLSLGGMFIESDADLHPEQEVEIRALLRHGTGNFEMKLRGWVVHRQMHGFGLQLAPPAAEEKEVLQATVEAAHSRHS